MSGVNFSVGDDVEEGSVKGSLSALLPKHALSKFNKKRRQSEIILPFRAGSASDLLKGGVAAAASSQQQQPQQDVQEAKGGEDIVVDEGDDRPHPLHIFTVGAKAPLELRRTVGPNVAAGGRDVRHKGLIHVLDRNNSGSVPNISQNAAKESAANRTGEEVGRSEVSPTSEDEDYFPSESSENVPSGGMQPNQLPRTLSTSVLRIKHKRSFWEKVVG